MIKKILLFYCGLASLSSLAQIGINTSEPAQTLHVSGTPTPISGAPNVGTSELKIIEPTIRIEGLNAINNPAHTSNDDNSLQRVYTTHEGDLVLKSGKSFDVLINEKSNFPTVYSEGVAISTNNLSLGDQSVVKVKTYDFEITNESLVYFSYGINTRVYRSNDKTEGHYTTTQYFTESFLTFSQATDPSLSSNMSFAPAHTLEMKRFAEDSYQAVNAFNTYINPNMYLSSSRSFLLKPGLYSVDLYVSNSGRREFSVGTNVPGENQSDFFKVIAIPTKR